MGGELQSHLKGISLMPKPRQKVICPSACGRLGWGLGGVGEGKGGAQRGASGSGNGGFFPFSFDTCSLLQATT